MEFHKKKINILAWAIIIGGTIVIVVTTFVLYQHTVNLLTTNLRQRIESIARSTVPSFDPRDIEELRTESDWQKPAWSRVVNQLMAIEQSHTDILFAYIFRKKIDDPFLMEFVADSHSINPFANIDADPSNDIDANRDGNIEPDGPDLLQWPGQDYLDPPEGTFRAYNGPTTSNELYEDSFGRVITGYAPIVSNGETIAVLAFDMDANDFFTITRQTLYPFLSFISALVFIILLLFFFIIRMWSKQVKREVAQRERIEKQEKELEVANMRLKELDQLKSEFVSLATHQIRGPLAAIKGYASMIREGDYGAVPDNLKESINTIFDSSNALTVVVQDFLDISRIEQGSMKYDITVFDLGKLVYAVAQELNPNIERKGLRIKLEIEPNIVVEADTGKLRQVISNLIDNALKYTASGSIFVTVKRMGTGTARIAVKDTGVGIKPETLPMLFQKFSRAEDASKANILGTGLGLYIAKKLVEAQKGKVWAESEGEGKGSTFVVELPLKA